MAESTWSPSPAAENLDAMQRAIAGYVLQPLDDEVLDCALQGLRRAVDNLNARVWNWTRTYFTVDFVAGTQEYDLDQGFKAPMNLALRDSSGVDRDRLRYLTWDSFLKEINNQNTQPYTGHPCYYTVTNAHYFGVLRMDVAPTADFITLYPTGRLWYYRRISYPTNTAYVINVPSEVSLYLIEQASGYAADRYAVDKAAAAYMRAEKAFRGLARDDSYGQNTDWE